MKKRVLLLILSLTLILVAAAPVGAVAAVPTDMLPSLTADGNCASYDSRGDSTVYYYTGVTEQNYTDYIQTLTTNGYTSLQAYGADGCQYSLLDNGTVTVFVSFLRSVSGTDKGRLRVFVQTSGTPYHTEKEMQTADVCEPMLWQLDVDNTKDDGGMSYVIRLTDGTFVIIDGGYNTEAEAKNLYSVLAGNNVLDGNPVISAWFITHLHIDHYGALKAFTQSYANAVTVKGFYYNFNSQTIGDTANSNADDVESVMKKWKGATLYSKIHSGMVMGFAGATVEVLATHEDVMQSYYAKRSSWSSTYSLTANDFENDGNETSTVLRFNVGGKTIMFLADAEQNVSDAMLGTYTASYLQSDIMQMAHHGFSDTVSADLIEAIDPEVVLWPMDVTRYKDGQFTAGTTDDTKTFVCYYNYLKDSGQKRDYVKAVDSCASWVIPAYQNEEIPLSDSVKELYKIGTIGETSKKIAAAKVRIAGATEKIYVQTSLDNTRLRIVGVLNITEDELDDYASFGFDIAMKYNGVIYKNSMTTTTVYTSIWVGDKLVEASEYNGTYFYIVEINGLDGATNDLEFTVTGTGVCIQDGSQFALTYGTGRYLFAVEYLKLEESGKMPRFQFSDILLGVWKESDDDSVPMNVQQSGTMPSFDFSAILSEWKESDK